MDHPILLLIALIVLALIALIAVLARRTGTTTTQMEEITLIISGVTFQFSQDNWQQIYGHLTADELASIKRLDMARDHLRAAERSGDATQVESAAREFNACFEQVHAAYQRAALAWLNTPQGKHWLKLQRLPQKSQ